MRKIILLSIFMTGVTICSYAKGENGNETGSVQGTIIDSETKKPVSNTTFTAIVRKTSFQKEIVTDGNGKFILNSIPVGEQTLIIDKVGYRAVKKEGLIIKEGMIIKIEIEVVEAEEEIHQPIITPITIHSF